MFLSLGFGLLSSFKASHAKLNANTYVKREIKHQQKRHANTHSQRRREMDRKESHVTRKLANRHNDFDSLCSNLT